MKRVLGCFVVLCLLGWAAWAVAAPGDAMIFVPSPEGGEGVAYVQQTAMLNGQMYMLIDHAVYRWQPGMAEPERYCLLPVEVAEGEAWIEHLAAGDGALWGVTLSQGRVARITPNGPEWLPVGLDTQNLTVQYGEYESTRTTRNAFVEDGALYMLRSNETGEAWSEEYSLLRYDLGTGVQRVTELEHARAMVPYQPGSALVLAQTYDEKKGALSYGWLQVDLASGAVRALPFTSSFPFKQERYGLGGLAYDRPTDSIYCRCQGEILRAVGGGAFETVAYQTTGAWGDSNAAMVLPGALYAWREGDGVRIKNVDPAHKPTRALRLQGGWANEAYQSFTQAYPDIPVLLLEGYYATPEELVSALLSGESQIDLFVTSSDRGMRALIEKGYAAPVDASGLLAEDVGSMYPWVRTVLQDRAGRLRAYPTALYWTTWAVDTALWEAVGMGPLPTTFNEYFDYLQRWEQEYAAQYPDVAFSSVHTKEAYVYLALDQYIRQYEREDQPVDFEHSILRALLQRIDQLPIAPMPVWEELTEEEQDAWMQSAYNRPIFQAYNSQQFMDENQNWGWIGSGDEADVPAKVVPIAPLVFEADQAARIPASIEALCINPNSPNADLALLYLEHMAQNLPMESDYALHPEKSEPVRIDGFERQLEEVRAQRREYVQRLAEADAADRRAIEEEIASCDRFITDAEHNQWRISSVGIAHYRRLAPYQYIPGQSIFFTEGANNAAGDLYEMLRRYIENQMTLDAFLREANRKMRMMFLEGK